MTPFLARAHGQAITEFIILLAGVILPFLLLMPLISKYQDAQHHTQMASRYVAFEARTQSDDAANWRTEAAVASEVQNRFFGQQDSPISSNPASPATGPMGWTDPTNQSLLSNPSAAVVIKYGTDGQGANTTDGFDAASDRFGKNAEGQSAFGNGGMAPRFLGLRGRGPFTATVEVSLNKLPARSPGILGSNFAPFDTLDMKLSARTSTLTSPWTAKDPDQVIRQMATREGDVFAWVFPSQGLTLPNEYTQYTTDNLDQVVSRIEAPAPLSAPQIGRLEFWKDVVPPDRLKPN